MVTFIIVNCRKWLPGFVLIPAFVLFGFTWNTFSYGEYKMVFWHFHQFSSFITGERMQQSGTLRWLEQDESSLVLLRRHVDGFSTTLLRLVSGFSWWDPTKALLSLLVAYLHFGLFLNTFPVLYGVKMYSYAKKSDNIIVFVLIPRFLLVIMAWKLRSGAVRRILGKIT